MEIINASLNDFRELAKFARQSYEHAFGRDIGFSALHHHLTDKMSDECFQQMLAVDNFYLALINGHIVGFAQVGVVDAGYAEHLAEFDHTGSELRRLYVKPELQSQGFGSALIGRVIEGLVQLNFQNLYLTTWEKNVGAQKLYHESGFKKIGRIPEYSKDGNLNGYEHVMLRKL